MIPSHSRKRWLGGAGAFATLALGPALPGRAADAYTLRFSHPDVAGSVFAAEVDRFANGVNRRADGQLKIEVFPNGQLAKQQETVTALASGTIDMVLVASSVLEPLFPNLAVFDMPFMFKNFAACYRVLDGPIGAEFFADFESKGILGLGWGSAGFKQLCTTTKPIVVPDDMKGVRIRIQAGAVFIATYQALGAIPVPIDVNETFTALSQHTVDAADFSLEFITSGKFYTVVKHIAMTNHTIPVVAMLAAKKKIDSLPVPLQQIIKTEAKASMGPWRADLARLINDDVQVLKTNGVIFTEVQYPAFRKAVDPVYAAFAPKFSGNLLERVSRAAGS